MTAAPPVQKDHQPQLPKGTKEMHQKALAEIELQQAKLREMIASKRAEKETLQAVYERLKKRGDDGKS
ncbi:unnamed protein product [Tuber melanosporum]|uniref:(Perigord truffle) hypothetical protein n=1 Tax=Tuber melanosporum (strain Mel28) TaxID=656061 RepID=D5G9H7_TUBMM|nr:uncharacterized protein GSTUM_00003405001 [Tuber melanosporum]CAZ81170.1 unnamed protein product [Tuber melanosporum]